MPARRLEDACGKNVRLEFVGFLFNEVKFDSLEQLSAQLDEDKETAKKIDI